MNTITINRPFQAEDKASSPTKLRPSNEIQQLQIPISFWQVEQVFRDIKSILETRPIYHKRDETIRGHVFCSFLALVLKKELDRLLHSAGHCFEWADIKQDLKALQETLMEDNGKRLAIRSECVGTCGRVFQAVGVAIPPTICEI